MLLKRFYVENSHEIQIALLIFFLLLMGSMNAWSATARAIIAHAGLNDITKSSPPRIACRVIYKNN